MEIKKVTDPSFRKYGRVVEGIDFTELVEAIKKEIGRASCRERV